MRNLIEHMLMIAVNDRQYSVFQKMARPLPDRVNGRVRRDVWYAIQCDDSEWLSHMRPAIEKMTLSPTLVETALNNSKNTEMLDMVVDQFPWKEFSACYADRLASSTCDFFVKKYRDRIDWAQVEKHCAVDSSDPYSVFCAALERPA